MGALEELTIGLSGAGEQAAWLVEQVEVTDETSGAACGCITVLACLISCMPWACELQYLFATAPARFNHRRDCVLPVQRLAGTGQRRG